MGVRVSAMSQTLEELKQAVKQISEQLKGHMPDIERALLVADRKEIRECIKILEGKHG